MEAISNLGRLRSALACSSSIVTPSITADEFDFWMGSHPGSSGFRFAVRQEINHLVADHIDKDRAELSSPAKCEIIYSKLSHRLHRLCRKRHDPAKNGHPGGTYS